MWLLVIVLLILKLGKLKRTIKWLLKGAKLRVMKPRSLKDCSECKKSKTIETIIFKPLPVPWSQKKGQGGRKKTISTQNYFCSNPECEYYLIADEQIHALVANGRNGKYEEIRDLKVKPAEGSSAYENIRYCIDCEVNATFSRKPNQRLSVCH